MKAEIIKIHRLKSSKTEASFIRVEFKMEDGSWAKTDIVPVYRNYKRWKPLLAKGVGTQLDNLKLRREGEVDADSYPYAFMPMVETISPMSAFANMPRGMKNELRKKLGLPIK